MRLTENFSLWEFEKSKTADYYDIDNSVPEDVPFVIDNILSLCYNVLQPVRNHFGKSVDINSGYRSAKLNKQIGGSSKSQHCFGEAADIEINGVSNKVVADYISENCEYDQLILEFYQEEDGPNSGWVHVSHKRDGSNRKQKLVALKNGKKTVYKEVDEFDESNEYEDYA